MTDRTPRPVPRSLVSPTDLYEGAVFLVPALAAPGSVCWWHVARLVDLGAGRVRVILAESDHRGRCYRVELHTADRVVWAPTLAPSVLAVPRLGHHVWCNRCGGPWGWLPVSVSNTPCFACLALAPVGAGGEAVTI